MHARSRETWTKKLVPHFVEHKCLIGLLDSVADDAHVLAKALTIATFVLKHAASCGSTALHEHARASQFYARVLGLYTKVFEGSQVQLSLCIGASTLTSDAVRDHEALVLALTDLVLSGNASGKTHTDVATQKYFALRTGDLPTQPHVIARSLFNCDAFRLFSDVLEYLHAPTPIESQSFRSAGAATELTTRLQQQREALECKCIEQIGRLVCHNRYDYVFAMVCRPLANGASHTRVLTLSLSVSLLCGSKRKRSRT